MPDAVTRAPGNAREFDKFNIAADRHYTEAMKKNCYLILFLLFLTHHSLRAQLIVNSGVLNPQQLVQTLVGPGVTISNVSFTGVLTATGSFTDTTGNLGMSNGIVLTSGSPLRIPGPNNLDSAQVDNLQPGDPQLDTVYNTFTFDATILEFDFVPASDTFAFNYRFGSEEYNEFVNLGVSDIFAFFVSGPGINGAENVALIPGTTTPVTIDSVNNGFTPVGTLSSGPCVNCQYYIDNLNGTFLQYDGYTTILTAGRKVSPCLTYHLKMVIADVGDGIYDSGIFLEAGSFKSTADFRIQFNGQNAPSTVRVCPGDCAVLTAPTLPNYMWSNGETTQSITVCSDGQYNVSTSTGTCSAQSNNVFVQITAGPDTPVVSIVNDTAYASVSGSFLSYQWYSGGVPVSGATGSSLALPFPGCFRCEVTDLLGCTAISDSVCDFVLGLGGAPQQIALGIRTGPDGSYTLLREQTGSAQVTVRDLMGRTVSVTTWEAGSRELRLSIPGEQAVYLVSYFDGEHSASRRILR